MDLRQSNKMLNIFGAFYLNIPIINVIVTRLVPALTGFAMAGLYAVIILLLFLLQRNSINALLRVKVKYLLFLSGYILIAYLISFSTGFCSLSPVELLVYVLVPILLISKIDFSYDAVIRYCPVISAFGIPFIRLIFQTESHSISMGLSYAFLPAIIFSLVYLFSDRSNKAVSFFSLLNMLYLIVIVLYGSRGPILSAMVCVLLYWLIKQKQGQASIIWKRVFLLIIVILLCMYFFWDLVQFTNNVLLSVNIKATFLDKLLILREMNDLSNGRGYIYKVTWELIKEKPILGYGIGTFDHYTSLEYPHNFILQLLFDLGSVGLCLVLIPVIFGSFSLLDNTRYDLHYIIAVCCSSIPGALLSNDLWKNVLLWLSFAMLIRHKKRKKYEGSVSRL